MMKPQKLPVYKQRTKILKKLAKSNVIVVESPTGSGKTTQLPQILYEAGYGNYGVIGITQPRRIAAVSVAGFIARQQGEQIPGLVGYKMRFDDRTVPETKIKVMTDGILLQEIKADYDLSRYSVIIVDEAHDRSLNIDFILGLLKRILKKRPEFKVIISSATINADSFSQYFDNCPIVYIDTVIFPIDVHYSLPPAVQEKYQEEALVNKVNNLVMEICETSKKGDILIFHSGVKGIKDTITALQANKYSGGLQIMPLYSRLSSEEQEKVFQEYPGKRKVIVATNIAETSITIDGIEFVIDTGLAKMNYYNPRTYTSSLIEMPISKAACNQRKGRAGRTQPGRCYRLYKYADYEKRGLYTLEEIFRTDLSEVVMRMAELGIKDFETFDFLSSPGVENIKSAVETLNLLDALDDRRDLTKLGKMMAEFPLLPRHSRIIVEAIMRYPDVLDEAITATSFLTTNSPFLLPQGEEMEARKAHHHFRDPNGDFISYLTLYDEFQKANNKEAFCEKYYLDYRGMLEIVNIKEQLTEIVSDMGVPITSGGPLKEYLCSISRGLIQFVCVKTPKNGYKSLTADNILIHPGSVMFRDRPKYIVAGEIIKTTKMYARSVSELRYEWLGDISSALYDLSQGGGAGKGRKKGAENELANQLRIGGEVFKVQQFKGKQKLVKFQWGLLKKVLGDLDTVNLSPYKGVKGTVIYKGYEILSEMKLSSLFEIVKNLNIDRGILGGWPRKGLEFKKSYGLIIKHLDNLLGLCKKQKKAKKLAFLALYVDEQGVYQFRNTKSFYSAVTESIASLEAIFDEDLEPLSHEEKESINHVYRKLTTLFNEKGAPDME